MFAVPIACPAQTEWVCPIIVAYRNGAPIRVTAKYGDGHYALIGDKGVTVTIVRDTSTELVGELHDPLGSSFGYLKVDKGMQTCSFSETQP